MNSTNVFRRCSSCKKEIPFEAIYYKCSVSTCNRARSDYAFCSAECQQAHSVTVSHRDAWAEQETAPTQAAWLRAQEQERAEPAAAPNPQRRMVAMGGPTPQTGPPEVLVVVSKLKKYVKDKSGMNTSDGAMPALSDHLRLVATEAIRSAAQDGRKTVMDRDVLQAIAALTGRLRP